MINHVDREFLLDEEVSGLEVTAAQYAILSQLLTGSAESACDLCKCMNYDRGAMSRMVDRLESKGLIRREPLAHTRRSVALQVTPAGKAAFPKMEVCVSRALNRLTQGISNTQIRQAQSVLRQMLANS
jgi:DNA-binding MarR family transcriptional regulator